MNSQICHNKTQGHAQASYSLNILEENVDHCEFRGFYLVQTHSGCICYQQHKLSCIIHITSSIYNIPSCPYMFTLICRGPGPPLIWTLLTESHVQLKCDSVISPQCHCADCGGRLVMLIRLSVLNYISTLSQPAYGPVAVSINLQLGGLCTFTQ